MATRARELWLILRARNEAKGALGSFARDVKTLQTLRGGGPELALQGRQLTLQSRLARDRARLASIESEYGSQNIAIRARQLSIENQIAAIGSKEVDIEAKRGQIVSRSNALMDQELRLRNSVLATDQRAIALETDRLRIQQAAARTSLQIASLQPGGIGRKTAGLAAERAQTAQLQAALNAELAQRRLTSMRGPESGASQQQIQDQEKRAEIAQRRFSEAATAQAIASQKVELLDEKIKDLNKTLGINASRLKENDAAAAKLTGEQTRIQAAIAAETTEWERLTVAERQVAETEAAHIRRLEELSLAEKKVASDAMTLAASTETLRGSIAHTTALMGELDAAQAGMSRGWQTAGSAMSSLGRTMAISGGVAIGVMGMMARSASEMSKQITLAATQARPPGAGIAQTAQISKSLFDGVIKQMQEFPASGDEMSQALYEIFSGTNVQNIGKATEMLRVFNQMAVAGGTDLKTMTDAGISLYNNFPGQFKNMTDAANQFFAVVRYGRMNAEQFGKSLSYILPVAKAAGLSFQDVGGAMAFLTRQTGAIRTTQDAQGLARLIQLFGRKDFVDGMHKMGIAVFDASGKMRPILTIMEELRGKTNMTHKEVLNFFKTVTALGTGKGGTQGTIQAMRVFASMYEHTKAARTVAEQVRKDTDEMVKSFRAMSRDPGVRWQVFQNQMHALAITIGRDLIPVFARIGELIAKLAQWFQNLSPHTRKLIAEFLAYGAVVTFVVGLLAALAGGLIAMFFTFRKFGGEMQKAGKFLGGAGGAAKGAKGDFIKFGEEAGFLTTRMNLVIGSVVILIGLLPVLHHHLGDIFNLLGGWKSVLHAATIALNLFTVRLIAARLALLGFSAGGLIPALAGMSLFEVAAIAIGSTVVEKLIRKIPGWDKNFKEFGGTLYDLSHSSDTVEKSFANTGAAINKQVSAIQKFVESREAAGITGKELVAEVQIKFQIVHKDVAQAWVRVANAEIDKARNKIHDLPLGPGITPEFQKTSAAEKKQQDQLRKNAETADMLFNKMRRLQREFEIRPTLGLAKELQSVTASFNRLPKATQNYYNQLAKNLGDVKVVSDRTVLAMARNVNRLRQAFERAPSVRTYQEWYNANKRFTTLATQDQQQFAQDTIAANQAAVQKIKQNFESVLNYVRGLYQGFLSEMQNAFGQLGQGPVVTQLNNQVQQIRDRGSAAAQALRDQAQQIQDAAQNAADNISATEGNLIDWGLMADPAQMKKSADAQAKALNKQADAIEKAANARADKLAKRLAEHKLTPKELLGDLEGQLAAFNKWQRHLNQLQRRGAPPELIKQLRALGPEYDNMLKGLLQMTPAQWRKYITVFKAGQRAQHKAAMDELRTQLKQYRKYGGNIVDAIAKGITDESATLRKSLIKLIQETFPGLRGGPGGGGRGTGGRTVRQHERTMHRARRPAHHARATVRHAARHPAARHPATTQHLRKIEHNTGRNHPDNRMHQYSRQIERHTNRGDTRTHQNTRQIAQHTRRLETLARRAPRATNVDRQTLQYTKLIEQHTRKLQQRAPARRARPRVNVRHHATRTDPRRHQNPPSVAHYHYHADKSHHMSADAYFRKMHFRHRNQRRC